MLDINLRQLETFVVATEFASFTRAAEHLHLTQSTVSMHIRTLEETLRTKLIIRGARRPFTLTEEGKRVYQAARDIVSRCESLQNPPVEGEEIYLLNIGTSTVPAQYLLPTLLRGFNENHSRARYAIRRSDSEGVLSLLAKGEVRLGLVGEEPDSAAFIMDEIARDRLVVITANTKEYRNMLLRDVPGNELLSRPMIRRRDGSGTEHAAEFWCRRNGFDVSKLNTIARMDNPEDIKKSVEAGIGVAVISDLAVQQEVRDGKLLAFPLRGEDSSRSFYIVRRKDTLLSPMENRFVTYVKEEAGALSE